MPAAELAANDSKELILKLRGFIHYYQTICNLHENEMLAMVDLLEETQTKWREALAECDELKSKLSAMENSSTSDEQEVWKTPQTTPSARTSYTGVFVISI
ncbi:hypothetical protein DdX_08867 [Ditylenchus destructor]|uniref:Uncharacterized protein n=1 Tax=Ditylenchus destructor TaxID=166010 RepID=A0AAD4N1T1_9BILA|nr:hypothetical protein DdX_08867 [Ditylenchus destructor]